MGATFSVNDPHYVSYPREIAEQEYRNSEERARPSKNGLPKYDMPDNISDLERLETQHYLMRYLWQSNFEAPVDEVLKSSDAKVLDVGCGHGTWIFELAQEYPNAQFTGIDTESFLPKREASDNVNFLEHDLLHGLPFSDNTFDFVHMRFLTQYISEKTWEDVIVKELVRVAKPGGWIEIVEFDYPHYSAGPKTRKFTKAAMEFLASKGFNGLLSLKLPSFLKATDQVDEIRKHDKSIALGKWAGKVGEFAIQDMALLVTELRGELSSFMNISEAEYDQLLESYKEEVEKYRTFFKTHRFFTQKKDASKLEK
ncbi:9617_t:CDS:2 [Paraglomus brasilianum]|uniref:9617_t:CDS:1 n=1 Tax=Paraglomus brasilianum TaxID=144538 RepID=A0A9N8VGP6_9GLOM|nr:9617_t:CDS:2 [Paraglomus brasilianum]